MKTLVSGKMGSGKTEFIKNCLIPEIESVKVIGYHLLHPEYPAIKDCILLKVSDVKCNLEIIKNTLIEADKSNCQDTFIIDGFWHKYSHESWSFLEELKLKIIVTNDFLYNSERCKMFDTIYVFFPQVVDGVVHALKVKGKKVIKVTRQPDFKFTQTPC